MRSFRFLLGIRVTAAMTAARTAEIGAPVHTTNRPIDGSVKTAARRRIEYLSETLPSKKSAHRNIQ